MDGTIRGDIYAEPADPKWDRSAEPQTTSTTTSNPDDEQTQSIEDSLRGLGYLQ